MLDALNWEPLSQRRAKNRVTMLYQIINNQVTIDPNTYLNKSDTRTRGEHKYKQIATSKNIYKYYFPPAPSEVGTTSRQQWDRLQTLTASGLVWRVYNSLQSSCNSTC